MLVLDRKPAPFSTSSRKGSTNPYLAVESEVWDPHAWVVALLAVSTWSRRFTKESIQSQSVRWVMLEERSPSLRRE